MINLCINCIEYIKRKIKTDPTPTQYPPVTKYIFNKCGTNMYFFTLPSPSPSRNFFFAKLFSLKSLRNTKENFRIFLLKFSFAGNPTAIPLIQIAIHTLTRELLLQVTLYSNKYFNSLIILFYKSNLTNFRSLSINQNGPKS